MAAKMDVDSIELNPNWKRKASMDEPVKKKKKKTKVPEMTKKTPSQYLNEMCRIQEWCPTDYKGVQFTFDSIGTVQKPSFRAFAEINNSSFEGVGASKQIAKSELAKSALASLFGTEWPATEIKVEEGGQYQLSDPEVWIRTLDEEYDEMYGGKQPMSVCRIRSGDKGSNNFYTDFTTDDVTPMFQNGQNGKQNQLSAKRPVIDTEKARSHPVMVLSEVFPGVKLDWVEGSGHGNKQFKVEAEVQGRKFFGEGRSKKLAKLNLAKTILLCMYDIHDFKEIEAAVKPTKALSEEALFEKKFPLTQLKELIGEDNMNVEVVQVEKIDENEEKSWHATIVVKGVAYEAVGKNRNVAKLHAAKKALNVLRPKKEPVKPEGLNKHGVDVTRHPSMVFHEFYRDVKFIDTESKNSTGFFEHHLEAEVEGKVFKVTASSKKKAKLRLVLEAFQSLKRTDPKEWKTIDYKDVLEDKPVSANPL